MDESSKHFSCLWQRRDLKFNQQNPKDKADSLRFFLSQFSYLKQSSSGFEEPWSLESRELEARRNYAYLMDSKTGINNYADTILSLRKGFKNDSMKWKCSLKPADLQEYVSVEQEPTEDIENEYVKLSRCYQLTEARELEEPEAYYVDSHPSVASFRKKPECPNFSIDSSHLFENKNDIRIPRQPIPKVEEVSSPKRNPRSFLFNCVQPSLKRRIEFPQSAYQELNFDSRSGVQNYKLLESQTGIEERNRTERTKLYPWEARKGSDGLSNLPTFKTASHQLAMDNLKRGSRSGSTKEMYGSAKRSLGPRGVKGGFVPPIRRENEKESDWSQGEGCSARNGRPEPHAELLADERLKNVDAKMVELIMNEILDSGPPVTWDDIAGLQLAKCTIQEIVVWPMLRPDIFTGLRGPPKGILLFGPPGTGKTMIGKCIASQSQSTFFSISASSLTSKWVGEGEKMVRAMFAVARCHQPAVIFIDEIDSLLTHRSDTEHESSRRIKTEFLVQLDGATSGQDERLLVVGATNRPQELDEAARRRLVKRLYIPLPDAPAREQIIRNLLADQNHTLSADDMKELSQKTDGYSGADMANLCREAALGPIRSIDFADIERIAVEQVRSIWRQDFEAALNAIRASVSTQDLHLYEEWNTKYGIKK